MSLSVSLSHQLDGFSLDAQFEAPQGVTALFGASGAGKTTIVNALAGLMQPHQGRLSLGDNVLFDTDKQINVAAHKRGFGYVFQDHRLFPHMSVQRNLDYGRRAQNLARNQKREAHVIEILGIGSLLNRYPAHLSGGEKQRVSIGRALLSGPRMLLLDEPLAALDAPRRQEILPYLERLRDEADLPMLYVSHSVTEVARLATTVVLLDQGKVLRSGPVQDVFSDLEIAKVIGQQAVGAVLPAQVMRHDPDGLTQLNLCGGQVYVPGKGLAVNQEVRLRIRAQDVMLSLAKPEGISALNVLQGQISQLQPDKDGGVLVKIKCGSDHLLSRITRRSEQALGLSVGTTVFAIVKSVSLAQDDLSTGNLA